jgi:plastocyanin
MRTGFRIAVAALVLGLLATACASDEPAVGADGTTVSPTEDGGIYGGPTGDDQAGGDGGGAGVLTLDQNSFSFQPKRFEVASGDTITVNNPSTAPHTFTITGQDIDVVNDPRQSQDVVIDLEPGTYDFVCRFHESRGMVGTLTVT